MIETIKSVGNFEISLEQDSPVLLPFKKNHVPDYENALWIKDKLCYNQNLFNWHLEGPELKEQKVAMNWPRNEYRE